MPFSLQFSPENCKLSVISIILTYIIEKAGIFLDPGLLVAFLLQCTSPSAEHNSVEQPNILHLSKKKC